MTVESLRYPSLICLGYFIGLESPRNVPYPHGPGVHDVVNVGEEIFEPVAVTLIVSRGDS